MSTAPSKKIHVFAEDKLIGDKGEAIIKDYLKSLPSINKVVDMANNKLFYHKDVDFVFERTNGKKYRAEIKTDQYKSGNIYYETISNEVYDTEGCMRKTACDYLFYYFINFDKLYILHMNEYCELMEMLIKENHPAIKKKSVKNQKEGYVSNSIGYTLPLSVLEEMMPREAIQIVSEVTKKIGK